MARELFIYAVFFEETKMKTLFLATLFLSITGIINAETNMHRENITIISFYSPWCAPCNEERKIIKEIISEKNKSIDFQEINYAESPEEALFYNVDTIPSIIILYNNREIYRTTGIQTKKEIRKLFKTAENYAEKCNQTNSKNC